MTSFYGCEKDCPDRSPTCHDRCEKYQTAKKQHLEEQRVINQKRRMQNDADAAQRAAVKRCAATSRRR